MGGWIKLHRKMLSHWVARDPVALTLFIWMLLEATHEEKIVHCNGCSVTLKRGQLLFGIERWAKKTGISEGKIRNRQTSMQTDRLIDRQKTNKYSIITILNYDKYQVATGKPTPQPTGKPTGVKEVNKLTSKEIGKIFSFWKDVMGKPNAKLTKDRQAKINARLEEGYSVDELISAIEGCKSSEFHMGKNDGNTPYNDIKTILRDGSQVEKFSEITSSINERDMGI